MSASVAELVQGWAEYTAGLGRSPELLLVDDEPGVLKLFDAVLRPAGFSCRTALTGDAALAEFAAHPAQVLLTDKNLPGIDGLELIRRVHQLDPDCEAILISGYANLESAITAIDLGTADYLLKPLPHISVLPATVHKALRRRHRRLSVRRMVNDLRALVGERAGAADWARVVGARRRWERLRDRLGRHRVVLLAQADPRDLRPAAEFLATHGYGVPLVRRSAELLERCGRGEASVVLLGDELEEEAAAQVLDRLLELPARPEIVLATANADLAGAVAALERGASGFLLKPLDDTAQLSRTVERANGEYQERLLQLTLVDELRRLAEQLSGQLVTAPAGETLVQALAGFDTTAAQVAVRILESSGGESAWGGDDAPEDRR